MSTFGKAIEISLFGESHGPGVGITIHNLPSGLTIDENALAQSLSMRKPKHSFSTARIEPDHFDIQSGVFRGKTTGAPLTFFIHNRNQQSEDYTEGLVRPGHADYPAYKRHENYDYRGGGHFSGRLTAPLILLGKICSDLLSKKNILVASQIRTIHTLKGPSIREMSLDDEMLKSLLSSDFPVLHNEDGHRFQQRLNELRNSGESAGGTVETVIKNPPVGVGEPFFDAFESLIAHLIYAIPGVKGIAFGEGFALASKKGSESNDALAYEQEHVVFDSNRMGGILGGLTTGEAVLFETAFKPTPTHQQPQTTINVKSGETVKWKGNARHDGSIVPRAVPVVNALTAYALVELITRKEGCQWML